MADPKKASDSENTPPKGARVSILLGGSLDESSSSDPTSTGVTINGTFGDYELKVPGHPETRLSAGDEVSRKVDEVLRERLKASDSKTGGKLAKAKKTLYKGTEKENRDGESASLKASTEAREDYKALMERYLAEGKFKKCDAALKRDGSYMNSKQASVDIVALCNDPKDGKKLLDAYKAAIEEEKNSSAFREAVFLKSLHVEEGPAWEKRLVLWIAGPSASGKSYAAKKAVLEMMQHLGHISEEKVNNYLLLIDGGVERDLSQVRKMMLGVAVHNGYSGLSDLHKHSKMGVKSTLKEIGDILGMHMGIPETFSDPRKSPEKEIERYSKEKDTIIGMANICGPDEEMSALCEAQGTRRALLNSPLSVGKISLNTDNPCESKEYEGGVNFAVGMSNSGNTVARLVQKFEEKPGRAFVMDMYTKPGFIRINDNGTVKKSDGRSKDDIRIEADDFDEIKRILNKKKQKMGGSFTKEVAEKTVKRWLKNHEKIIEAKDASSVQNKSTPTNHVFKTALTVFKHKIKKLSKSSLSSMFGTEFSIINLKPIESLQKEIASLLDEFEKLKDKVGEIENRVEALKEKLQGIKEQYQDEMESHGRLNPSDKDSLTQSVQEFLQTTESSLKCYEQSIKLLQQHGSIERAIDNSKKDAVKAILTSHRDKLEKEKKSHPINITLQVNVDISRLHRESSTDDQESRRRAIQTIQLTAENVDAFFKSAKNSAQLNGKTEQFTQLMKDSLKGNVEEHLLQFRQLYKEIHEKSPNSVALLPLARAINSLLPELREAFKGGDQEVRMAAFFMRSGCKSLEENINDIKAGRAEFVVTTSAEDQRLAGVTASDLSLALNNCYPQQMASTITVKQPSTPPRNPWPAPKAVIASSQPRAISEPTTASPQKRDFKDSQPSEPSAPSGKKIKK